MMPRSNPTDSSGKVEQLGYITFTQELESLPSRELDTHEEKTALIGAILAPSHAPSQNVFPTSIRLNRNVS